MVVYQESTNYRFDLSITDIVDIVSATSVRKNFQNNKVILDKILDSNPINFYNWFVKLKELADKDEKFFKAINRKLYVQLYDANRMALRPQYKYIDLQKIKDNKILGRIARYNKIANNSEGLALLGVFAFYLFRCLPTSMRTGYDGHPDENFLRKVLHLYL